MGQFQYYSSIERKFLNTSVLASSDVSNFQVIDLFPAKFLGDYFPSPLLPHHSSIRTLQRSGDLFPFSITCTPAYRL